MSSQAPSYHGYRFPSEIISHTVWLYYRFGLSFVDVEDLSIKEECLNRVISLGEAHLRLIVHEYVEHYHRERHHQGLDNQLLQRPPPPRKPDADVRRRVRLGGLLSFYYREAV